MAAVEFDPQPCRPTPAWRRPGRQPYWVRSMTRSTRWKPTRGPRPSGAGRSLTGCGASRSGTGPKTGWSSGN